MKAGRSAVMKKDARGAHGRGQRGRPPARARSAAPRRHAGAPSAGPMKGTSARSSAPAKAKRAPSVAPGRPARAPSVAPRHHASARLLAPMKSTSARSSAPAKTTRAPWTAPGQRREAEGAAPRLAAHQPRVRDPVAAPGDWVDAHAPVPGAYDKAFSDARTGAVIEFELLDSDLAPRGLCMGEIIGQGIDSGADVPVVYISPLTQSLRWPSRRCQRLWR